MGWFKRKKKESVEEFLNEGECSAANEWLNKHFSSETAEEIKQTDTMTRQDYITAIQNGEYAIECDSNEVIYSLLLEVFPNDVSRPHLSDSTIGALFYSKPGFKYEWCVSALRFDTKSIKASTLANMKEDGLIEKFTSELLSENPINIKEYLDAEKLTSSDMKDETKIKLLPENAQRIINIACTTWKTNLAALWSKSIVLNQTIEISQSFYQDMRSACTPDQHKLFDEIFGPDVPGLKIGDYIILYGDPTIVWELCDDNKLYSLNWNTKMWQQKPVDLKFRFATPGEIRAVQYPPDGTPCWVSIQEREWVLRYSNGRGQFYDFQHKSGNSSEWNHVKPFDPNNLPFNE